MTSLHDQQVLETGIADAAATTLFQCLVYQYQYLLGTENTHKS